MSQGSRSKSQSEGQLEELSYYEVTLPYPAIIPAEHGIRLVKGADLDTALLAARIATPTEVVKTLRAENPNAYVTIASLEGTDQKSISVSEWMEMGQEMRQRLNKAWCQYCDGQKLNRASDEAKRFKQELRIRHALYLPDVVAVA